MELSELINPGDKIDIQLTYQLEQQHIEQDVFVKTFTSGVHDIISDNTLEIAMPMFEGKMILFQVGLRCEVVFYTKKGLYKGSAVVQDRSKKDNFFVLIIEIEGEIQKYQRRAFFRMPCQVDMKYYAISEDVKALETTEALLMEVSSSDYAGSERNGVIQDISGGGIRFTNSQFLEPNTYILVKMQLTSQTVDEAFCLVCRIVACEEVERVKGRYSVRAMFLYKDLKDREIIVRYVFDEERRVRKKENG